MTTPFNISALMAPRNVVLVGASDRNWSPRIRDNLKRFGFEGAVYAVNPNRSELWGARCYPTLADLPEPPDHLALFVPNEASLDMVEFGGSLGARSASIYAAGFGEGGDARGLVRAARLKTLLEKYSIAATGPNCMGLAVGRSRFCTFPDEQVQVLAPGPVAALTQSGALAQTFARGIADAGLTLAYLVSLGNQTGLTFADYIDHLSGDPDLRVITCYIESVVDGDRFLVAAEKARHAGKHVIVVKAGGTEDARKATLAHTGSLAGSTAVFDAFARDVGVLRVDALEDLIEAAAFLSRAKRPKGRRVAVITNSGALKSLMTEAAERYGVEFAKLAPETAPRLTAALHDAECANPFDSKRTIRVEEYMGCVRALHDDPNVDLLLVAEELPRAAGIERKVQNLTALDAWAATEATKSFAAFSAVTFRETEYMTGLRAELTHFPWLRDIDKTFRTLAKITAPNLTPARHRAPIAPERRALVELWRARATHLNAPTPLSETESKALLAAYGIFPPPEATVQDAANAIAAAERIGYPVVLKAISAGVPHKSDAGLVLLHIDNASAVREAVETIVARCAKIDARLEGILVAKQIKDGVEMVLGIHRDAEMGPVVMVGMGGVWLELFKDVAFAPPGLGRERALETIAQTRASTLLNGYRGSAPLDVGALANSMVALGRLASELGDVIESVDVNPLLVRAKGEGVVALDGLVVLRSPVGGVP